MDLELYLNLFSVGILQFQHSLAALAAKTRILPTNQNNMDCYIIVICLIVVPK